LQLFERYRQVAKYIDLLGRLKSEILEGPIFGMTGEELLKRVAQETIEKLLDALPPEELVKWLPPEERVKGLSVDEILAALSPEMRAALAQRFKDNGSPTNPAGK
jgi:hypothetical protein